MSACCWDLCPSSWGYAFIFPSAPPALLTTYNPTILATLGDFGHPDEPWRIWAGFPECSCLLLAPGLGHAVCSV